MLSLFRKGSYHLAAKRISMPYYHRAPDMKILTHMPALVAIFGNLFSGYTDDGFKTAKWDVLYVNNGRGPALFSETRRDAVLKELILANMNDRPMREFFDVEIIDLRLVDGI